MSSPCGKLASAAVAAFRSATPIDPGRYHNCKDPCGVVGCIGFAAQVARDLREAQAAHLPTPRPREQT